MTLSSFKKNTKLATIPIIFVAYGAVSYLLGATNFLQNINLINFGKIKGEQAKSKLNKPIDSPVPYADTQTTTIVSSYVKRCSNTQLGFEVSYPKDWFTTYNNEQERCTFFAQYSFTVPQDTSGFITPIKIEVYRPDEFPGVQKFYENPNDFQNVISAQNVEINGRAVQKIKAITTGGNLLPKNLSKISFLYPDTKLPMVLTYQQQDLNEDVNQNEKILEEMVRSVNYF